ncbi:hypothetical protein MGALJ_19680 [Mycobacterium gallinarum]|uniref:Uncharacterized protein n=1 Tax=Mycobacterium gallinarum TaxID=39689 RepID=A0A9W4B1G6_9MYCO|nr:hypothetical protein [Mycobacterium gallinarum]BBY92299.1 hypothetical protein MGALJ_19680 [Mycobacterium gallinarum]
MASTAEDRAHRAELAEELGFVPATLDAADIERHRRLKAAADTAPSRERIWRKYAHLREQKRRSEVEAAGCAAVSDLYE